MASSTFSVLQTANFLSIWPTDWIIIGAFAAFVALDALRSGSARAAALALAIPATMILSDALARAAVLGPIIASQSAPAARALVLAILLVILFVSIHRIIYSFSERGGPLQGLISGVAAAVVLVVFWLQVPALDGIWHFGDQVQLVFGEPYRFWWLIGSYIALAFVRG